MSRRRQRTRQESVSATFEKGINRRIDITQGDPSRLHTLKNARITGRGSTYSVSRIEGFAKLLDLPAGDNKILDMCFVDDDLFVYWTHYGGSVYLDIYNVDPTTSDLTKIKQYDLGIQNFDRGEITRQANNIYLSPTNKMVNMIGGEYYLNDISADYPKFV